MRIAALVLALLAGVCLYAGMKLLVATHRFASGDGYRMELFSSLAYSTRTLNPDGHAIYGPPLLLLVAAAFFGRFAYKVWKDKDR